MNPYDQESMQLFINRPGTSIYRNNNQFDIRHAKETHHISPLQVQSMLLISVGIKISSDAMLLAIEHDIDLLIVDHDGQPQARICQVDR